MSGRRTGVKLQFNFGGSGMLEQQIENGAPADVFFAAAPKPMDALAGKGLIVPDTRRDILRNQIVLIAPRDSNGARFIRSLGDRRGETGRARRSGQRAGGRLRPPGARIPEPLGRVQHKLVLAKDVRQVLTYVETGNAEAGIVYATDAKESAKVRVAAIAPEGSHTPVIYPAAVIAGSRNQAAARAFVTFLSGSEARDVFTRHGFTMVSP